MTRSARRVLAVALLLVPLALAGGRGSAAPPSNPPPSTKLRGDLAALVSGADKVDPRLPGLIAGYQPGELAYFAVLSEPDDATHQAQLTSRGARVLRRYASIDAFALASSPTAVLDVAALSWVKWLAPVEVVYPLAEQEIDQSRGTTADIGAPTLWNANPSITGSRVTIAILDTGVDTTHPDLDDLDFRNWASPLNSRKVADPVNGARNFNGSNCEPLAANSDFFGHGTHVAGIAAGTGEGTPLGAEAGSLNDNGRYAGIAPGAKLVLGKVLTDAGAGVNSDLIAAMEWAAMPAGTPVPACAQGSGLIPAVGADIVNMSLGSESRPNRLNTDSDVDMVGIVLNRLAVTYGTLFTVSAGNSGPFIGSLLEAPGAAAQGLSVAASAKTFDLNNDNTLSGDACAGWMHPGSVAPGYLDNECDGGPGNQPPSLASFTSRGPSGDVWLRPDVAAPGLNIVSAQATAGAGLAGNDLNIGTRDDPLYATASGTSMAAPATAGGAALLLDGYRAANNGASPSGGSGVNGVNAPAYVLIRAALMNTALSGLYDARWILNHDQATDLSSCPVDDSPYFGLCALLLDFVNTEQGASTVVEARNRGPADPYVGPLSEGAGRIELPAALTALRDGVVIYSAATGTDPVPGTGHRDFQGSWQVGAIAAGTAQTQRFVAHSAPNATLRSLTFSFSGGAPSDGSSAIPGSWVSLPGSVTVPGGGDTLVDFAVAVPASAAPGIYTGTVVITVWEGAVQRQVLRVPVFAAVVLHDTNAGMNAFGPQGTYSSAQDVYGKWDTVWPSAGGQPLTGTGADWRVFPVELGAGLVSAVFSVYDSAHQPATDTYDLYLYDSAFALKATTHPFLPGDAGATDVTAALSRAASSAQSPQTLTLNAPTAGRYYLAVSRARFAGANIIVENTGSFVLKLDEVKPPADLALTKTDSPDPVLVGNDLTYTITVRNDGPGEATGVVVSDPLPATTAFVSAGSNRGACTGGTTVACTVGTLASGGSATITIKVRPTTAGTITNTAAVTANEGDPDPSDNTASATTTVSPAADIAVTNIDSPDPVKVGRVLTYTVRVTNNGPSAATGVVLDDQLPKNAGFGSATASQGSCSLKPSKGTVSCSLGSLASGAVATATITLKPTAKGTVTNTATATASSPGDPNTANNTATATTTVTP